MRRVVVVDEVEEVWVDGVEEEDQVEEDEVVDGLVVDEGTGDAVVVVVEDEEARDVGAEEDDVHPRGELL